MSTISTDIPEYLLAQAHARSLPDKAVIFLRYYPQIHRWITFRAVAPSVRRAPQTTQPDGPSQATVTDTRTGQTFTVPASHAAMLQQIFSRGSGGISFSDRELKDLEQAASVIRVMHLVYEDNALSAGQPGHSNHQSRPAIHTRHHRHHQPQQLTYTTVPTPPGQKYWTIRWHLSNPSRRGGWIVQHIVMNIAAAGTQPAQHLNYWEAWQIPQGSRSTIYFNLIPYDDMFRAPTGSTISGRARFYEGLTLPPSFIPNNAATAAGILPATTTDPKLPLNRATSTVPRNYTAP